MGQRLEPDRAVLACRVVEPDQWCRRCGCEGVPPDGVTRRLEHEPLGWRPTTLVVTIRYRCGGCGHVWRQDTGLSSIVPKPLTELITLGKTLKKRATDAALGSGFRPQRHPHLG